MRGFLHSRHADVSKHTPSAQLLPGARAPTVTLPHRSSDNNAGFVLVRSLIPEMSSSREVFLISEEEIAERLERSQEYL